MIITISNQKGGVGKSTIAWNIAVELSKQTDKHLRILDLDAQKTLTMTNQLRNKKGLRALDLLPFDNDYVRVGLDAKELKRFLECKNDDEIIIIDSGGYDNYLNRLAIMYSDMILTPVSDKPYDLMGLRKYEEILKELSNYNTMIKTYIVFNNINPSMKNFGNLIEFILSSHHYILMVSVLRQRSDISYSVSYGKSVNEYSPKSKSAQEVNELVTEIKEILAIA